MVTFHILVKNKKSPNSCVCPFSFVLSTSQYLGWGDEAVLGGLGRAVEPVVLVTDEVLE